MTPVDPLVRASVLRKRIQYLRRLLTIYPINAARLAYPRRAIRPHIDGLPHDRADLSLAQFPNSVAMRNLDSAKCHSANQYLDAPRARSVFLCRLRCLLPRLLYLCHEMLEAK
jgi:hypothetical protein